jgi:non-homologous end joining protein Ku
MAKAFRKGLVLQFGLINTIGKITGAVDKDDDSDLITVCDRGGHAPTKISMQRHCATCNDTVGYTELKKAKEVGGQYVVVDQSEVADVKNATLGATKKMLTVTVHPRDEVKNFTLQGDSVYVWEPDGAGQDRSYATILDAIERHPEYAFLTVFTPTSRAALYELKAFNGQLVLEKRVWPDQIRHVTPMTLPSVSGADQAQFDMLLPLVATPFVASDYSDTYAVELANLLATKTAVDGIDSPKAAPTAKPVASSGGVDLSSQLAAMVAAAQAAKAAA